LLLHNAPKKFYKIKNKQYFTSFGFSTLKRLSMKKFEGMCQYVAAQGATLDFGFVPQDFMTLAGLM
jgi:hypothetical protein